MPPEDTGHGAHDLAQSGVCVSCLDEGRHQVHLRVLGFRGELGEDLVDGLLVTVEPDLLQALDLTGLGLNNFFSFFIFAILYIY